MLEDFKLQAAISEYNPVKLSMIKPRTMRIVHEIYCRGEITILRARLGELVDRVGRLGGDVGDPDLRTQKIDALVDTYDLEKIRTIGDNYMVASGVPRPREDHAAPIVRLALEMEEYIESVPAQNGIVIGFRVGVNSSPLVAGVIGRHKFLNDTRKNTPNSTFA